MWIEAKIMIDTMAFVCIGIVMLFLIPVNVLLSFLLIVAIGLIVFSDLIYGYITTRWWVKPWFEKPKPSEEMAVFMTISGMICAIFTKKKAEGKREWVWNKQEASCINHGDAPLHTPGGNRVFLSHEDHDENLKPEEIVYAQDLHKATGVNTIQDIYELGKKIDEMEEKNAN